MNRRAQAAMIATATLVVGCARTRASLPPQPSTTLAPAPLPGPVELTPLEPIRASINQGKIPTDTSTVRASYSVGESTDGPPPSTAPPPRPATPARRPAAPPSEPIPAPAPPARETTPEVAPETPIPQPVPTAGPSDPPPASAPAESVPIPAPKPGGEGPAKAEVPNPASDEPAKGTTEASTPAPGSEPIRLKTDPGIEPGKRSAYTVAMVGGTVITLRELKAAVCQRFELQPGELQELMHGSREQRDQFAMMAKSTIEGLVDNALLLQEAQREMKKNWTMFTDFAEKSWKEKELPRKLKKYEADDEFSLRKKMEARGESLEDVKDLYKQESMARDFLMVRLQPKVDKPGKPQMEAYYIEHRNDPEFHREARVYWHEILIPVETPADLASAKKSAESVRARLAKGEEFAKIARSTSHGATASKGGAWETTPGGHPVAAINAALGTLKPGEVSSSIVGPKGVHIVRVDRRTTSGPAPFVEVQKQIADDLFKKRFSSMVEVYLKKLREKTTITWPIYDQAPAAPAVAQQPAKQDPEAQRTAGP
jgi:parvulin-like peptidyl-prolyl isomerase